MVRVCGHGDSSLTHEICALSTEAHRHLLRGGVRVVRWLLLNLLRFVLLFLIIGAEKLIGWLLLHLRVWVDWLSLSHAFRIGGLSCRGFLNSLSLLLRLVYRQKHR